MSARWFGPKRIGWGLTPVSWQGWALTAVYIGIVVVAGFALAPSQPWLFWTLLGLTTVVYLLVRSSPAADAAHRPPAFHFA